MQQTVCIATASSDEYVPFLCVLLRSILDHVTDSHDYCIIVISDGICEPHKAKIQKMFRHKPHVSCRFVDAAPEMANPALYTRGQITRTTYSRLTMLDLPTDTKKLIYLDADVVVNVDPADLYSIDLLSNCLAAVRDPMMTSWCIGKRRLSELENLASLGISDCREYFNAGVMLIDLQLWHAQYTTDFFFQEATEREWRWFDQDILNKVFHNRVLYLDQTWNFMTCTEEKHRPLLRELLGYQYNDAFMPKIVHYAGHTIPCFRPRVINGKYFWKYAFRTPYFGIIVTCLCQHLLHKISKIIARSPEIE